MRERGPELPDRIRQFLVRLEELRVYVDYLAALNIKWDPPSGKAINLAYIKRNGQVSTEASNWFAPKDLSHHYNEDLAKALGGEVNKESQKDDWYVTLNGHAPRIEEVVPKFDDWYRIIERFIESMRERQAEGEE